MKPSYLVTRENHHKMSEKGTHIWADIRTIGFCNRVGAAAISGALADPALGRTGPTAPLAGFTLRASRTRVQGFTIFTLILTTCQHPQELTFCIHFILQQWYEGCRSTYFLLPTRDSLEVVQDQEASGQTSSRRIKQKTMRAAGQMQRSGFYYNTQLTS